MNLPVTYNTSLSPASADEIRGGLKVLFSQFPSADGDAGAKMLGYVIALEGEPKWAVESAVRKFLRGEVQEHDGKFLPSSAELARVTRAASAHARKMHANAATKHLAIKWRDVPGPEESARIAAKADAASAALEQAAKDGDALDREQAASVRAVLENIAAKARERAYRK